MPRPVSAMMKGIDRLQACGGARAAPGLGGASVGASAGASATRFATRAATATEGGSDRTATLEAPGAWVAFPVHGALPAGASCWQHCGIGPFNWGRPCSCPAAPEGQQPSGMTQQEATPDQAVARIGSSAARSSAPRLDAPRRDTKDDDMVPMITQAVPGRPVQRGLLEARPRPAFSATPARPTQ
jgi:hypothetical protein